jgi:hypothetical protein
MTVGESPTKAGKAKRISSEPCIQRLIRSSLTVGASYGVHGFTGRMNVFDMPDCFSRFDPISLVAALFWGGVLALAASIITDRLARKTIRDHWQLIMVLVLLVLSWRIPWDGIFFHGLEYEDSYVYTVASRQMVEIGGPRQTATEFPYSIHVCALGSLKSCEEWEPFPEHFIGYPYAISQFSWLVGYSPNVASIENVAAACLTDVLIFLIALLVTGDVITASAAAIIYAITPVFAVYGLETSAEPASNACLSVVIWFYVRSISALGTREDRWRTSLRWCALTAVLLFSVTVKREDILLAVLLPLVLPLISMWRAAPRFQRVALMLFFVLSAVVALGLCVHMRLSHTAENEQALLRAFPFTMQRLATFVFGFTKSFLVNRWYGGTVAAVGIGAVVSCRRRGLFLVPFVVFVAFGLLYAFHIRSYYEMRSGQIETMAALRFSMNLMTAWALLAGIGIGAVVAKVKELDFYRRQRRTGLMMGASAMAALLIASFAMTVNLRADAIEDETNIRFTPARKALQFVSRSGLTPDYLVTIEPLIVQMFADSTVPVVDLANIDVNDLRSLAVSGRGGRFVYLDESLHQSEADSTRYGEQMQYMDSLSQRTVYQGEGFRIVVIDLPPR